MSDSAAADNKKRAVEEEEDNSGEHEPATKKAHTEKHNATLVLRIDGTRLVLVGPLDEVMRRFVAYVNADLDSHEDCCTVLPFFISVPVGDSNEEFRLCPDKLIYEIYHVGPTGWSCTGPFVEQALNLLLSWLYRHREGAFKLNYRKFSADFDF